MAVSASKSWVSGEILSASDLNAEFTQVYSNGEDLGWPATKAKDLDGNELILDADGDTSITADTDDQIDIKAGGTDVIKIIEASILITQSLNLVGSSSHTSTPTNGTGNSFSSSTLTTGKVILVNDNSTDTGVRNGFEVRTSQAAATGATTARFLQSSTGPVLLLDKGTTDGGFLNFGATVDSDATSAISDLTTSGSTTHHVQVEINGTKAWIAVSTTNPS